MTKNNNDILQELMKKDIFEVAGKPVAWDYRVNINEDFEHTSQFDDLVAVLEDATENDQIRINLSTNGGSLVAILPLLGAMKETEAHVHVHAASDVASAGTFLLMKAHSVSINDHVTIMCHNVSFGSSGTGSSVASHVSHVLKSTDSLLKEMYYGFFTEQELNNLLSGSDFYMDKEEFILRYEERNSKLVENNS